MSIADDETFTHAGLDSLDSMNLVLEVEGLTGLNFGEFNLSDANTIDEFYGKAEGTARAQRVIHRGRSQEEADA